MVRRTSFLRAVLHLLHITANIPRPLGKTLVAADDRASRPDFRPLLRRKTIKEDLKIPLSPVCRTYRYIAKGSTKIHIVRGALTLPGRRQWTHCTDEKDCWKILHDRARHRCRLIRPDRLGSSSFPGPEGGRLIFTNEQPHETAKRSGETRGDSDVFHSERLRKNLLTFGKSGSAAVSPGPEWL